ncbi:MAG: hypothetical protein ACI4AH_08105, partial [Muribaculaceae bacterium]
AGATLELVRTDAKGSVVVDSYEITDAKMALADLVKEIGEDGVYKESFTTDPGDAIDAQYQLVLKLAGGNVESNIVYIVGSKVSNTSVAVHRSGTPDAATCATKELFRNEIKFTPANTGIGTGYYIYCNGEKVMTLRDGGNLKFTNSLTGEEYAEAADGSLTVVHYAETTPIAEGENGSVDGAEFYYAVVHYDDATGNTYGSAAAAAGYTGAISELVVAFEQNSEKAKLGQGYTLVYIRPTISWKVQKDADDVTTPLRYDIYMKVEKAPFEVAGETSSGDAGNISGWEGDNFGKYILRYSTDDGTTTTFSDDIYYARKQQYTGSWVNAADQSEIRPITYYVKAIYSDSDEVAQNEAEKNSNTLELKAGEGGIFTAIDDVQAEGVSVSAEGGVITVTGVTGTITVYSAAGQTVATAEGNGSVTTIDASNLNGIYIVKANNMIPTKILIK